MLKAKRLPPPEKFTLRDVLQILLGVIMIPLGALILVNTFRLGVSAPGLLIGGAFIAFGVYRVLFAWGRIRWYRRVRGNGLW